MKSEQPKQPAKGEKKPREESVVISFRIPVSAYEPYRESVLKSGKGRSAFFRDLFFGNKDKVVITEKKVSTEDYNRYLHFVSKISNNINQLARLLNGAEKAGLATAKQYMTGLNNLNSIRLLLQSKLGKKD